MPCWVPSHGGLSNEHLFDGAVYPPVPPPFTQVNYSGDASVPKTFSLAQEGAPDLNTISEFFWCAIRHINLFEPQFS